MWYNFRDLQWQYDWRGSQLQNLRILVCCDCLDTPQEQLRAIVLPADPLPIVNARPELYVADTNNVMAWSATTTDPVTGLPIPNTTTMATVPGVNMAPEPIGVPTGLEQDAVMPQQVVNGAPTVFDVPVPFLSIIANGTDRITVSCSAPHGLTTNNQISVEGLSLPATNGIFSVTVTTATAFTYQVSPVSVPAGSLLTDNVRMVTCNVGLPYDYTQVPLT